MEDGKEKHIGAITERIYHYEYINTFHDNHCVIHCRITVLRSVFLDRNYTLYQQSSHNLDMGGSPRDNLLAYISAMQTSQAYKRSFTTGIALQDQKLHKSQNKEELMNSTEYDIIVDAIRKMATDQIDNGRCPICNSRIIRIGIKRKGTDEEQRIIRCTSCKEDLSPNNISRIIKGFLGVDNVKSFIAHLLQNIHIYTVLEACAPINGQRH